MTRKYSVLLLAAILLTIGTITEVFAQVQIYGVSNRSTVTVTVAVSGTCGGGLSWISLPVSIAPGASHAFTVPSGCPVNQVILNGTGYPVGYSGPVAPPNPPNFIRVGAGRAVIY
jgi:hypothetical protein